MSTGNLYRYFPSKLDIAEMFVRVLRGEHVDMLREILDNETTTPTEKLREFFVMKFKLAYERFHDKPKAFELSNTLLAERPKVGLEWEDAERRVLSDILNAGNAAGVFAIDKPLDVANILQDAAYRFTSPVVFHEGEYDELETELHAIIDLMLDGFAWRKANKNNAAA